MVFPRPYTDTSHPNVTDSTLDDVDEKLANVFRIGKSGIINKVLFRSKDARNGTTVLDVRLETVDLSNGDPSGNLFAANANASQTVLITDDNVLFATVLTKPIVVSQGDLIAIVLDVTTSPATVEVEMFDEFVDDRVNNFYTDSDAGAGYVKSSQERNGLFALEYDDGFIDFNPGLWPVIFGTGSVAYNNASTPDERALRFKFPFTCRIVGVNILMSASPGDFDLKLYDLADSLKASVSIDKDQIVPAIGYSSYYFTSPFTLLKNTSYRCSVLPTSATNVVIGNYLTHNANMMKGMEGGGDFHLSTRADAGAWTDTTTERPYMSLLIDAFDDGVAVSAKNYYVGGISARQRLTRGLAGVS